MNIRILGAHNCESESTRFVCLLIDDTVALDAGGLTSSLSISDQQKLKAILLTHQHYDHIRDVPAVAVNLYLQGARIDVYCTRQVRATIETHILNGQIYPKFQELPEAKPTINFNLITPYKPESINGYEILAIPVNHDSDTVGYQVRNSDGKVMFYTADTGPGLLDCWQYVSPQVLIVDATVPNRYQEFAINTGHLTPSLLHEELIKFRELKGYLPRIVIVHMNPDLEKEIKEEVAVVAEALNTIITVGHGGMQLNL